jgi:PAS domain S-box-containing protein
MSESTGLVPASAGNDPNVRAPPRMRWKDLLGGRAGLITAACIAATYYGAAKLGLALAFENSSITAVWPPTGIALAALVLCGRRYWPAVALGAFFANSWTGLPLVSTLGITAGNTLEALVGAYLLLNVARFRPSLDRVRDVLALVAFAAVLSTMVSATFGVTSLWIGGEIDAGQLPSAWRLWWLGDMGGDLIVAPVLFAISTSALVIPTRRRTLEGVSLIVLLIAIGAITFSQSTHLAYLTFPLLAWSALRFGQMGATAGTAIVAVISVWFTARGIGPFSQGSRDDNLLQSQTFVGVASAMSLLIAAFVAERSRARAALERARYGLEQRVQERTAELTRSLQELEVRGAIARNIAEGVALIRAPDATIVYANASLERMFGYEPGELDGSPAAVLNTPSGAVGREGAGLNSVVKERGAWSGECLSIKKNGIPFWCSVKVSTLEHPEHGTVWISVHADITARKLVERGLRQSERQLRQVLETAQEAFVSISADGLIRAWNPQAEVIFGWARSQVLGTPLADTIIPASYREAHKRGLARFLSTGTGPMLKRPVEIMAQHRDGHEFPVEMTISPLKVAGGYVFNAFVRDISERKRAEQELRNSRARLAEAQQLAHLGSWEWDLVAGRLTWSDEIYRIFGLDSDSVEATPEVFERCVHPSDRDQMGGTVRKALKDCSSCELEYRIVRPDGEVRVLHGRGEVVTDANGRAIRMLGTALDVTEQKRLEEVSRRFWNLSLDLLAIFDFEGNLKSVNPAHRRILGYSDEELLGRRYFDRVHPDDQQRVLDLTTELATTEGEIGDFEIRIRRRDGQYRTLLGSAKSNKGERRIYTVAKDITEWKRAEEAERLAAIVESSDDAIVSIDLDRTIRSWNPGAERLYGYSAAEMEGRSIATIVPTERLDELAGYMAQVKRGRGMSEHRTVRMGKEGQRFDISLSVSPIRDEDGRVTGASAIHRDISDHVQAEREKDLLEAELDAAHRMESIGQLAGGVAHDFNNILAVIMNYARFVADEVPENSRASHDIKEIRRAADRAARLTHQLLIFGRRDVAVPQVLSVNAVVSGLDNLLRSAAGEHIRVETRLEDDPWHVKADAGQIEQVLINLVVNARDSMPDGGTLTIATSNAEPGEAFTRLHPDSVNGKYVRLTVRDSGTGMSDEVAERAFEPFFTTKPEGEGTGLGLATVYGIVKHANGVIDLDSVVGRGTTVDIYLPATPVSAATLRQAAERASVSAHGETVLLVEDEVAVREMAERILGSNGYSVLSAENGEDALDIWSGTEQPIDLLLTDVIMPKMLGTELADRIFGTRAGLRVLYMSGYGNEAVGPLASLDGSQFIEKPFSAEELLDAVRGVLDSPIASRA